MHRTIEMIGPPSATDTLCRALQRLEHVTGFSIHPGASLKPVGAVVVVHGLNRGADAVLQCVQVARGEDVSNLWICYPLGVRENYERTCGKR
jgi:hypothetical protein